MPCLWIVYSLSIFWHLIKVVIHFYTLLLAPEGYLGINCHILAGLICRITLTNSTRAMQKPFVLNVRWCFRLGVLVGFIHVRIWSLRNFIWKTCFEFWSSFPNMLNRVLSLWTFLIDSCLKVLQKSLNIGLGSLGTNYKVRMDVSSGEAKELLSPSPPPKKCTLPRKLGRKEKG